MGRDWEAIAGVTLLSAVALVVGVVVITAVVMLVAGAGDYIGMWQLPGETTCEVPR